jgi:hypothetical protein
MVTGDRYRSSTELGTTSPSLPRRLWRASVKIFQAYQK